MREMIFVDWLVGRLVMYKIPRYVCYATLRYDMLCYDAVVDWLHSCCMLLVDRFFDFGFYRSDRIGSCFSPVQCNNNDIR